MVLLKFPILKYGPSEAELEDYQSYVKRAKDAIKRLSSSEKESEEYANFLNEFTKYQKDLEAVVADFKIKNKRQKKSQSKNEPKKPRKKSEKPRNRIDKQKMIDRANERFNEQEERILEKFNTKEDKLLKEYDYDDEDEEYIERWKDLEDQRVVDIARIERQLKNQLELIEKSYELNIPITKLKEQVAASSGAALVALRATQQKKPVKTIELQKELPVKTIDSPQSSDKEKKSVLFKMEKPPSKKLKKVKSFSEIPESPVKTKKVKMVRESQIDQINELIKEQAKKAKKDRDNQIDLINELIKEQAKNQAEAEKALRKQAMETNKLKREQAKNEAEAEKALRMQAMETNKLKREQAKAKAKNEAEAEKALRMQAMETNKLKREQAKTKKEAEKAFELLRKQAIESNKLKREQSKLKKEADETWNDIEQEAFAIKKKQSIESNKLKREQLKLKKEAEKATKEANETWNDIEEEAKKIISQELDNQRKLFTDILDQAMIKAIEFRRKRRQTTEPTVSPIEKPLPVKTILEPVKKTADEIWNELTEEAEKKIFKRKNMLDETVEEMNERLIKEREEKIQKLLESTDRKKVEPVILSKEPIKLKTISYYKDYLSKNKIPSAEDIFNEIKNHRLFKYPKIYRERYQLDIISDIEDKLNKTFGNSDLNIYIPSNGIKPQRPSLVIFKVIKGNRFAEIYMKDKIPQKYRNSLFVILNEMNEHFKTIDDKVEKQLAKNRELFGSKRVKPSSHD
jgi:colicin import membrane protein